MSIVMRWTKRIVVAFFLLLVVLLCICNVWIVKSTEEKVFSDLSKLPDHRVALVLGTSHKMAGGAPNPYFEKRIETAALLYRLGKVNHFILSGDNRTMYYNEPWEMRKALIKAGVPENAITLDYAGLRTLDSVVRSKKIFGQDKITIITQPFHSYRALFISHYYNIDAVAMVADEPAIEQSLRVRIREYFARTKAVLDLYIFKTSPRFLGRKEQINITV
ncbi:MAG TPA: ElyC/SanA/YdcF family protein [Chryseosolibacter sp.]|nr:ElyC/SanA/YdcF family protein [Chryseosolibacter sp.]